MGWRFILESGQQVCERNQSPNIFANGQGVRVLHHPAKPINKRLAGGSPGAVLKRRILFKKSKPLVRPLTKDDLWVLWAAYKEGSFPLPEMSKDDFYSYILKVISAYSSAWLIEDDSKVFKDKRGPVCIILVHSNGWKIEPHVDWFKWATKQNILRSSVRFFNWVKQSKEVGVCVVKSLKKTSNLFHHIRSYGVLNFVGRIPGGDKRGDEYIFSIRGRLEVGNDGLGATSTSPGTAPTASTGTADATGPTSTTAGL